MVTTTNRYKGSATKILALDQQNGIEVEQMLAGIGSRADEQPAQIPFSGPFRKRLPCSTIHGQITASR
jgi:hypothetical protein